MSLKNEWKHRKKFTRRQKQCIHSLMRKEKSMDIKEIMQQNVFVVVGDTIKEEKYAYKIKNELLQNGYTVHAVGKELASINDIEEPIDIIDLCINPIKGLQLMKECTKEFKSIVIQPGAESEELLNYLQENNLPYIEGCVLVGLSLYSKNK
jgi:predicted CoA-binding protein